MLLTVTPNSTYLSTQNSFDKLILVNCRSLEVTSFITKQSKFVKTELVNLSKNINKFKCNT